MLSDEDQRSKAGVERDTPGTERKRPVCKSVVPGARLGRTYLLLPAPQTLEIMDADSSVLDQVLRMMLHAE